jgi:hypothetical protein
VNDFEGRVPAGVEGGEHALSWQMWSEAQESTPKPLSKDGVTAPPATAWQFKLRWKVMLPRVVKEM